MRAVSYFFWQSYCARNPSSRAEINEGVSEGVSEGVASWFTIALAEIRTRRILKEKADSTQSIIEKEHLKSISNNFVFAIHAKPTL